jgi:hypothetical protein
MIKQTTKKTAHLLVTCCVEETRFEVLKSVVASLKTEQENKDIDITSNLWVIDNGSTFPGAREFIKENFTRVLQAETNYGFWSVINWFLKYLEENHAAPPEYLHIIESDHTFFALEKLLTCEAALDKYPHIGSIRCQEFVVAQAHLYDKDMQSPDSKSYAWVRQRDWDGTKITYRLVDDEMKLYESRLVPLLHSVNRLDGMRSAFAKLATYHSFAEQDFQRLYREVHPLSGLLDGGLFHTKLTWDSPNLSASWSPIAQREAAGYRDSRHDKITPIEEMVVTLC